MQTLYEILGIQKTATLDDIKRAYRNAVKELHPDVNPDPSANDKFIEVEEAYSVLSDDDKRRAYDFSINPQPKLSSARATGFPNQAPFLTMRAFHSMRRMRRDGFTTRAHAGWDLSSCPLCAGQKIIRSFRDNKFVVDQCPRCR